MVLAGNPYQGAPGGPHVAAGPAIDPRPWQAAQVQKTNPRIAILNQLLANAALLHEQRAQTANPYLDRPGGPRVAPAGLTDLMRHRADPDNWSMETRAVAAQNEVEHQNALAHAGDPLWQPHPYSHLGLPPLPASNDLIRRYGGILQPGGGYQPNWDYRFATKRPQFDNRNAFGLV